MTPEHAAAAVDLVASAWNDPFTPERAAIWMGALMDLPAREVKAAIIELTKTRSTTPTPAVIRKSVMKAAGVLPPALAEAIGQAEVWLEYRDSLSFSNGSGWEPERPNVHPAVERACKAVLDSTGDWSYAFRAAYGEVAESTGASILSGDYGSAVAALGAGNV